MTRPEPPVATAPSPTRVTSPIRLLRFDRVERVVHWVNATLFGILMLTGATLYAGPLSVLVGNREVVRTIHVWSGLLLPIPVLVAVALRRRDAGLRADLRRLNRWDTGDARWFRKRHRGEVRLGKFNPGQKLNAAFIAGAGVVMLATGSIMHWFEPFPIDWRTGATFMHDWFAIGIWIAVIGHILFALRDPVALGGMVGGTVPEDWAAAKAPRWHEELRH